MNSSQIPVIFFIFFFVFNISHSFNDMQMILLAMPQLVETCKKIVHRISFVKEKVLHGLKTLMC